LRLSERPQVCPYRLEGCEALRVHDRGIAVPYLRRKNRRPPLDLDIPLIDWYLVQRDESLAEMAASLLDDAQPL
jgi:hypothetical protein